jgi:hypothetical protein
MSRTVQDVKSLASPDPSEIHHRVEIPLSFLHFRVTDLIYSRNGVEGMPEKEGLIDVYCTSLQLASAVRCYELVLDVSLGRSSASHEFINFLAVLTPAQVYYPD